MSPIPLSYLLPSVRKRRFSLVTTDRVSMRFQCSIILHPIQIAQYLLILQCPGPHIRGVSPHLPGVCRHMCGSCLHKVFSVYLLVDLICQSTITDNCGTGIRVSCAKYMYIRIYFSFCYLYLFMFISHLVNPPLQLAPGRSSNSVCST